MKVIDMSEKLRTCICFNKDAYWYWHVLIWCDTSNISISFSTPHKAIGTDEASPVLGDGMVVSWPINCSREEEVR